MEIKNLEIKQGVKKLNFKKGLAVLTLAAMLTQPVITQVEAASYNTSSTSRIYYSNSSVMNYFYDLCDDINETLEKSTSSTNLKNALNDYNILYEFIYENEMRRGAYYSDLNYDEQNQLNYLLEQLGNDIYSEYKTTSYFKSTTKSVLGHYLEYTSTIDGLDEDHELTMEYYTDTQADLFDSYLKKTNSQSTLNSALTIYKNLVNFIKGNVRQRNYTYPELTDYEQGLLYDLLADWTYDLYDEYSNYSYYKSSCTSKVGWVVNEYNLDYEMSQYIPTIETTPNYPQYPNYTPTVPSTPVVTPTPSVPSTPVVTPTTPSEEVQNQPSINNTVTTDWHSKYQNPYVNTTRGDNYDYVPEYIDEYGNYDYNQNTYGYYDAYGNYVTNNQYNQYQDAYVEDYVPTYIPR